MAELSALYASALFQILLEASVAANGVAADGVASKGVAEDVIDDAYKQAVFIRDTLNDDDVRRVLEHPHITNAEKRKFFGDAFKAGINGDLYALLLLVIDKNREAYFLPAIKTLINTIERYRRKTTANVVTARALDPGQTAVIIDILSKKLNKRVEVKEKVDPSVIGGPFINVDGYYIDRTIKRRLQDLAADMKVGCGA